MNILVLLSGLTGLLDNWGVTGAAAINGDEVSRLYFFLIPLFLNLSLSTLLAKEKNLDQISTLLIAMVCFFRASGFLTINASAQLVSHQGSILTSIPCTWVAVELLYYFSNISRFRFIHSQTDLSPRLKKTLNLIIPGLLTVVCFETLGQFMRGLGLIIVPLLHELLPRLSQIGATQELILFKFISQATWFLGIHGEYSADGLFRLLKNIPPGEQTVIYFKAFHDVFMNMGGSGATFIIPILILLTRQTTQFRSIAKLSLPFAFFNVNEILLFGLPIILNPIFLIPFFLAPFVNMVIGLTAMQMGLFTLAPVEVHWMAPPLYGAYVATNGSMAAILTQLACILVDGCIYYPFLVIAGRQFQTPNYLRNLFGGDAFEFINEEMTHREERRFLTQQQITLNHRASAQQVLEQLRGGEFLLYYQPKIDARTLQLVGLEALLRCRDATGNILSPSFLPVLYQQGLSKAIDQKVVKLAIDQVLRWRRQGLVVPPVSLNFDKDFLLDPLMIEAFIQQTQAHGICFYIEITEHTYTVELATLASVILQLRLAGHRISIDDFGAGYSSLSHLVELDADEIKLDRKLVVAPEGESSRGQVLLSASVQLCHDLGFEVVAEGIETQAQLELVQQLGVDVIQGYYSGRPMDPAQVSQQFVLVCEVGLSPISGSNTPRSLPIRSGGPEDPLESRHRIKAP